MDSIKALADTNLKISEAKNLLFKIQEEESNYLIERENKAIIKIQETLDSSRDLIKETKENYQEVHDLAHSASQFAGELIAFYEKLQDIKENFDKKSEIWEESVKKQNEEMSEIRKSIDIDKLIIENDKKSIEDAKIHIKSEYKRIESRNSQIKSALEVLNSKK